MALAAILAGSAGAQRAGEGALPNGEIYFASDRGGESDLYAIKPNGQKVRSLLSREGPQLSPSVAEEGVVFAEPKSPTRSDISTVFEPDFDGSGVRPITSGRSLDIDPVALFYGQAALFSTDRDGDFELRIGFAKGAVPKRFRREFVQRDLGLGPGGAQLTDNDSNDTEPSLPPGNRFARSQTITFTSDRGGSQDIWLLEMNEDSRTERPLVESPAADSAPTISPDESMVAFSSDRDGDREIFVVDTDGSNLRQLTENGASDTDPVFSPDGTQLAFSSDRDGDQEIYTLELETGGTRAVTDDPAADIEPTWARESFAGSRCFGRGGYREVRGTDEPDAIIGGPEDERVRTGSGRDVVRARDGRDCIFGQRDGDNLYGNGDRDTIFGGGGFDRLHGGPGKDLLNGGQDADKLRGGDDGDSVFGGTGNDIVFGGKGPDHLDGGRGADNIGGGSGNDYIFLTGGRDRVSCGSGRDVVVSSRKVKPERIDRDCETVLIGRGGFVID